MQKPAAKGLLFATEGSTASMYFTKKVRLSRLATHYTPQLLQAGAAGTGAAWPHESQPDAAGAGVAHPHPPEAAPALTEESPQHGLTTDSTRRGTILQT